MNATTAPADLFDAWDRAGHKMRLAVRYVLAANGRGEPVTAADIARLVGPHGATRYGYPIVTRCIDAGLVEVVESDRVHHSAAGELVVPLEVANLAA